MSIHAVIVVIAQTRHGSCIHPVLSSSSSTWRPATSSRSCRTNSTASWTTSAAFSLSGGRVFDTCVEVRGAATVSAAEFRTYFYVVLFVW